MHIFSNLKVVGIILALVAAGFFFMVSNKPKKVIETPPPAVAVDTTPSVSFEEQAEQRRAQMLEEKADLERKAKLLRERENSVECQFWKQQKSVSSEAKVDEKIIEFCTFSSISSTSDANSSADTSATEASSTVTSAAQ